MNRKLKPMREEKTKEKKERGREREKTSRRRHACGCCRRASRISLNPSDLSSSHLPLVESAALGHAPLTTLVRRSCCSWSSTSSPSPSPLPAVVAHQTCDGETFISTDDLRINLWNLEISNQSFNIVDVKPANMEDLTEMENFTTSICWELVKEGYIAIWRKALNNSCYLHRDVGMQHPLCDSVDDSDNTWV
ncbi:hypothetical protein LWI28_021043 [Acer negundo]|uniref:Uncharacterized protein n=1 Tax=Acer negundo TaxID=4023 RepID=A0AAD5P2I2_ACENE|nr:hypothetical protein LWI28_021043 [Acer negundo]